MSVRTKIRATLKRVREPIIRERLLMIYASYERPFGDIAKDFGCSPAKICYWKKRYEKLGLKGLHTLPKKGRPKKITEEQAARIRRRVKKHNIKRGWRTTHIRNAIFEETGIKYCERQVIRIAQSWGLSMVKPRSHYAYSKTDELKDFLKKQRCF